LTKIHILMAETLRVTVFWDMTGPLSNLSSPCICATPCYNQLILVDLREKQSFCEPLKPATEYGDLLMSLCYVPSDRLTVTILKAWDLRSMDINLKSDPYVKLCLKSPDRRVEKRKTKTVKCTLNPIFNEAFNFNVTNTNMEESSLEIVVMDFDNIGRDELIGRLLLAGRDGSGEPETKHWLEMLANPTITVVQWHRLRAEARSKGRKGTH
ncbi:synaptotagmin-7, partial [Cryptotermes secundus]|uniref:synaptotagmin-7 n=1 Tax=Cryptotermes secundus TaxID=105785 RepID=UPI000CD7DA61